MCQIKILNYLMSRWQQVAQFVGSSHCEHKSGNNTITNVPLALLVSVHTIFTLMILDSNSFWKDLPFYHRHAYSKIKLQGKRIAQVNIFPRRAPQGRLRCFYEHEQR